MNAYCLPRSQRLIATEQEQTIDELREIKRADLRCTEMNRTREKLTCDESKRELVRSVEWIDTTDPALASGLDWLN